MEEDEIVRVIEAWQDEFRELSANPRIRYVQIFENKGSIMGNSNPHPHGQIWAQESIPVEPAHELKQFEIHYRRRKRSLLADYLRLERRLKERLVYENASFAVVVPYWAVWPYETIIISRRRFANILHLKNKETRDFANALSVLTRKYDNLFTTSFPYSAGLHQAPTDGKDHSAWHFHMHFYPPLLRSAGIKKFMVGYEMLAEPQRDITPELSALVLRKLSAIHYSKA
jgi:UDPglucose--hexose-1-phosphate uridylyltransferase